MHCAVTSPPYWGLRDYGTAKWRGGHPSCDHNQSWLQRDHSRSETNCRKCGARRVDSQLGLEPTPELYVAHLVEVFRELRRVLRHDGTLWLNLGDSYATGGGKVGKCPGGGAQGARYRGDHARDPKVSIGPQTQPNRMPIAGLKPKDLCGIPWRVAFALQADGWYLRSDIIWAKPNQRPESVRDRPTTSHEHLFLLAKSERYYYDAATITEPCQSGPSDLKKMREQLDRIGGKHKRLVDSRSAASSTSNIGRKRAVGNPSGRNRRTVWTIHTARYKGAHFATFPPKLIEPCILAGCPEGGTVFDPFAGAGTTGLVAAEHGRKFIGIELNAAYVRMARKRMAHAAAPKRLNAAAA